MLACAAEPGDLVEGEGEGGATGEGDLPLGDLVAGDAKADGNWGSATTCKAIPDVPGLPHPRIVVSLHGLTLHLVDTSVGYDRVFPIGPGAIDTGERSSTYGESRSYYPLLATGSQEFSITPSRVDPCAIWWTDPETGQRLPVFAGLPFMSWYGSYGIHGPIDGYRASNGGSLRRGFVSHGCVRMESADVLEVYARIRRASTVPVHVQREPERDSAGNRVDLAARWIGSECASDSECNFTGGLCMQNAYSGRGFCSARCTRTCADRAGYPTTFCAPDPGDSHRGFCTSRTVAQNQGCRPYDHFVPRAVTRFGSPATVATVCMPGSGGWVGDRCFADSDCTSGTACRGADSAAGHAGTCTMACDRYCADQPGYATTFCADDPAPATGSCLRRCTPESGAPECAAGSQCIPRAAGNNPSRIASVCVPM